MTLRSLVVLATALLVSPVVAWGQDDDDFLEEEDDGFFEPSSPAPAPAPEEEEEEAPPAEGTPATPAAPEPDEDEGIDFEDEVDDEGSRVEEDLFEAEGPSEALLPGTDTPRLYRAKADEVKGLASDEEVMAWEAYLQEYPNSVYKERIEARMEELISDQYGSRIARPGEQVDAEDEELLFVLPAHMANINPRTKAQIYFEYGFPNYQGGILDFEYALFRSFSVHGGFTGRTSGWGLELGGRWAFVKSTKLQFIATLIADVRINFGPVLFQARPMLGFGKIIGPAQLLLTVGAEIGARAYESVALIGGLHVHVRVAEPVAVFAETDFRVEQLDRSVPFAFDVVTLGLKFYPKLKGRTDDPVELGASGHVPAATQYLGYYVGAVGVQGAYYPKAKYVKTGRKRKK